MQSKGKTGTRSMEPAFCKMLSQHLPEETEDVRWKSLVRIAALVPSFETRPSTYKAGATATLNQTSYSFCLVSGTTCLDSRPERRLHWPQLFVAFRHVKPATFLEKDLPSSSFKIHYLQSYHHWTLYNQYSWKNNKHLHPDVSFTTNCLPWRISLS